MASLGCLVGEQDGRHVTVRGGFVELDGDLVDDIPLAELDRRINCPVCREQLLPYRRGSGRFLRHRQGEAHADPVLNYAGESNRHYALKHYVTDVYVASKTWGARAEDWTDSRTRRPDVTCWPKPGRSRSTAGVDHTKTAYEIQLVDISDADVERRTFDHKADGVPSRSGWKDATSRGNARTLLRLLRSQGSIR